MAIADLLLQSMPLGYRFKPSDIELIDHYLKGKICGKLKAEDDVIAVIDVCKCEPWDLPDRSLIKQNDPEWFFFSPKDRKFSTGQRSNRATERGYWKATGKDRLIKRPGKGSVQIGTKKTLVFHLGRAPNGKGTPWIMHEYRTTEPEFESGKEGGFVLYKLFKKPKENMRPSDIDECNENNVDEMEGSDMSVPTPRMCVPDGTHNGNATIVTFVQPVDQIFPKQEVSQSPPLAISMQPSQVNSSSEVDVDYVTSYLSNPVDGSGSETLLSDVGDHETDVAGIEVESLLGDIALYFDQDCTQFSPADFHKVHSFDNPTIDYSLVELDEGLPLNFPHNHSTEEISVSEFLDSLICDPDGCFPGGYFANGDSVSSCIQDVTDRCSLESVLSKESDTRSDESIKETTAQDIVDQVDESIPTLPSNYSQTYNYICHMKESCSQFAVLPTEYLSRRVSFGPDADSFHQEPENTSKVVGPEKAIDLSNNMGTETIQDNYSVPTIQVRSRVTSMESSAMQQGSATRRFRLLKVQQRVSDSGQELETMERNVHEKLGRNAHESTVSKVMKHEKDIVKQEQSISECISSHNNGITCTKKMAGNSVAFSDGSNSFIRLVGLIFAIFFVVVVACWYSTF